MIPALRTWPLLLGLAGCLIAVPKPPECLENSDCPSDGYCRIDEDDPSDNRCSDLYQQCASNSDCASDEYCSMPDRVCDDFCIDDDDCLSGQICCEYGTDCYDRSENLCR